MLNHKIYEGNETEIFHLTGCLSTCDKYDYAIQPFTNLQGFENTESTENTYTLKFVLPTGRHEQKEQVAMVNKIVNKVTIMKWCSIIAVHNL